MSAGKSSPLHSLALSIHQTAQRIMLQSSQVSKLQLSLPVFRHRTLSFVAAGCSTVTVLRLAILRTGTCRDIGVLWHSGRALLQTSKILVLRLSDHLCQNIGIVSPLGEPYQPHKQHSQHAGFFV